MNETILMPMEDITAAAKWWSEHKEYVNQLINSSESKGYAYPPTGSDQFHPELWRAPHWRWFTSLSLS